MSKNEKEDWLRNCEMRQQCIQTSPATRDAEDDEKKHMLYLFQTRVITESCLAVLYLRNVRRGPIVIIRELLREWFPRWALLVISLLGGSVMEIVIDH